MKTLSNTPKLSYPKSKYDIYGYGPVWMIATLVDITQTGEFRKKGKARNQQRNFDTLVQIISMFSQPKTFPVRNILTHYNIQSIFDGQDPSRQVFGDRFTFTTEMFKRNYRLWVLPFTVEHYGVFGQGDILAECLHNIPVNTGLDESQDFPVSVFDTQTKENKNTIIFYYSD